MMTAWETIGTIFVGAAFSLLCNWVLMRYMFRWQKREQAPDDLAFRMGRLEDAFIAYTGETLNGKPFKRR